MAMQLPFDLAGQQDALSQRQKLAQALIQSSLGQQAPAGQMVSGHYVANPLAALMPLAQAFVGTKMGEQNQLASADLVSKYNSALSSGLDSYYKTAHGAPGQTLSDQQARNLLDGDQDPGKLAEPVAADPKKALIGALTSQVPELRDLGKLGLTSLLKQDSTPETFGHSPVTERDPKTGQLITVSYGNRGTRRVVEGATPYEKPIVVADRVVNPADPAKPLANYETTGGEVRTDERGDKYQIMSNGQWKKLDNAPKVNVTTNSSTLVAGQKAGMEAWSRKAADTVDQLASEARGSVKLLGTLNQLETSGKAGVFSGPTATPATFIAGLGESLGVPVDRAKLANTQTFGGAAISAWQDMIKQAGGNRGVVKEEAQQIMQMVPQLSQSAQGRQQLTAYLRQAAQQNIADAQRSSSEYAKALRADNPELFTFGLSNTQIPRSEALGAAPGAAAPAGSGKRVKWSDLP